MTPDIQRWIATLGTFGLSYSAVALATGHDYDTVRKWASGEIRPSEAAVRHVRLLAVALAMAPGLRQCLTLGEDDDVAATVDGLKIRAVLATDPVRTLADLALRVRVERDDVYTERK